MQRDRKRDIRTMELVALEVLIVAGLQTFICETGRKMEQGKREEKKVEKQIQKEMKCFPVPIAYWEQIQFEDSYLAERRNGVHEGCDIMDKDNQAGAIPVISATDGEVTNIGWLYLGGYRVGITTPQGNYYYYAHLDSYVAGLKSGKKITAGELLGFMGNTGEGEEGTTGKFDVHLHFGIYVRKKETERSVNPYPYLKRRFESTR